MSVTKLVIVLDKEDGVFVAKDEVSGAVLMENDGPVEVRSVVVTCRGAAVTDWKERSLATKETKRYHSEDVYFELKQQVYNEEVIPPGEHTFKFSFTLPDLPLPSSFESAHGFVRYMLKVVLDRPWRFDSEAKLPFTYVSSVDLNSHQETLAPASKEEEQFLCCCCCKSGPIKCSATVRRTGFVCGEIIPFEGKIENRTNSALAVRLEFLENVICRAENEEKIEVRVIKSYGKKKVEPNGYVEWNKASGLEVTVPPVAPSNLPPCKLIRIEHVLQMTVEAGTFHLDMELPFKLCIGTVPFAHTFADFITLPVAPNAITPETQLQEIDLEEKIEVVPSAATYEAPTLISNQYPNAPLPVFEDGYVKMGSSIKDDDDSKETLRNFNPRYPVYQLSTQD